MRKISSKFSIIIALCSILAAIIVGTISIVNGSRVVKSDAEEKLIWMAREYSSKFSSDILLVEDKVAEMQWHIENTINADKLKNDPDYLPKYSESLSKYFFEYASVRSGSTAAWVYFDPNLTETPCDIYFVDQDNDGIPERQDHIPFSYYDETPTPTDDKYWWYGAVNSKGPIWTSPYEWTLKNGKVIKVVSYSSPIYIEDQFVGVVGTYYFFDKMYNEISSMKINETGYASLYNEELSAVVHPEYFVGTRYTSDNLLTLDGGKHSDSGKEIFENDYGILPYFNNGVENLLSYSKLSNGWVLAIALPQSELYSGVASLIRYLTIGVLISIILSIITARIMGKLIGRPIEKVVQGAKQIGTGDLSFKIEVDTKDEIHDVANAINDMVEKTKLLQTELVSIAYYDDLTGLPNKNLFEKEAGLLLSDKSKKYAYILLDINKFNIINDMYGIAEGDSLLKHIAAILSDESGSDEISARFSADNFHILLNFIDNASLNARLKHISSRITEYSFADCAEYKISIGFGVYVIENPLLSIGALGDRAKLALSKIKGIHGSTISIFTYDNRSKIIEAHEIENTMEAALMNREFKLYLQPKFGLSENKPVGAEALVRWLHPTKGLIPPNCFIPVFEKNGFILDLDTFMLEEVCKVLRMWIDSGKNVIPISINQSRQYLLRPGHIEDVVNVLAKYNIPHNLIELEITETAFFDDQTEMAEIVNKLHSLGFRISMDDFGSGYSSLNMLQNILVDVLKIDKNFFDKSINSERGKKLVESIIAMVSGLEIEVVAEGIETQEQIDFIKNTNCNIVQGYYFSKPIPVEEFNRTMIN